MRAQAHESRHPRIDTRRILKDVRIVILINGSIRRIHFYMSSSRRPHTEDLTKGNEPITRQGSDDGRRGHGPFHRTKTARAESAALIFVGRRQIVVFRIAEATREEIFGRMIQKEVPSQGLHVSLLQPVIDLLVICDETRLLKPGSLGALIPRMLPEVLVPKILINFGESEHWARSLHELFPRLPRHHHPGLFTRDTQRCQPYSVNMFPQGQVREVSPKSSSQRQIHYFSKSVLLHITTGLFVGVKELGQSDHRILTVSSPCMRDDHIVGGLTRGLAQTVIRSEFVRQPLQQFLIRPERGRFWMLPAHDREVLGFAVEPDQARDLLDQTRICSDMVRHEIQ